MIDLNKIKPIFAEKLLRTGSFDEAMMKVCWICYSAGVEEGKATMPEYPMSQTEYNRAWDEARIDTIGQNGNDGEHYGKGILTEPEYLTAQKAFNELLKSKLNPQGDTDAKLTD